MHRIPTSSPDYLVNLRLNESERHTTPISVSSPATPPPRRHATGTIGHRSHGSSSFRLLGRPVCAEWRDENPTDRLNWIKGKFVSVAFVGIKTPSISWPATRTSTRTMAMTTTPRQEATSLLRERPLVMSRRNMLELLSWSLWMVLSVRNWNSFYFSKIRKVL